MKIDNLTGLKIYEMTDEQYKRRYDADEIEENALYVTPRVSGSSSEFSYSGSCIGKLPGNKWSSCCYGNGIFVATTNYESLIAYSDDGYTWREASITPAVYGVCFCSVCFGVDRFVAIGSDHAAYSVDGITWQLVSLPECANGNYTGVCYGADKFIGVTESEGFFVYSYDGIAWEKQEDFEYSISDICYGNGRFVACHEYDTVLVSEDGLNWVESEPVDQGYYCNVCFGKGMFISACRISHGGTMYSTDGYTWMASNSDGQSGRLSDIAYAGGKFILSYEDGAVSISNNGLDWTQAEVSSANQFAFSAICYGKDKFVAVGSSNIAVISYDGQYWGGYGKVSSNGEDITANISSTISANGVVIVQTDTVDSNYATMTSGEIYTLAAQGKRIFFNDGKRYIPLSTVSAQLADFISTSSDYGAKSYYIDDNGAIITRGSGVMLAADTSGTYSNPNSLLCYTGISNGIRTQPGRVLTKTTASPGGIPMYNSEGNLTSCTPTKDNDVATKLYVDTNSWANQVIYVEHLIDGLQVTGSYDDAKTSFLNFKPIFLVVDHTSECSCGAHIEQISSVVYNHTEDYFVFDNKYKWSATNQEILEVLTS